MRPPSGAERRTREVEIGSQGGVVTRHCGEIRDGVPDDAEWTGRASAFVERTAEAAAVNLCMSDDLLPGLTEITTKRDISAEEMTAAINAPWPETSRFTDSR